LLDTTNQDMTILDFDTRKLKYLKNLSTIKLTGFTLDDLSFFSVTKKLQSITLIDCKIKSLDHLSNYPELKNIRIEKTCIAKDLCTLVKCPKLELLEVPVGTNTGCFPEVINFAIKMI
jgi:hypothetical protein